MEKAIVHKLNIPGNPYVSSNLAGSSGWPVAPAHRKVLSVQVPLPSVPLALLPSTPMGSRDENPGGAGQAG